MDPELKKLLEKLVSNTEMNYMVNSVEDRLGHVESELRTINDQLSKILEFLESS